MTLGELSDWLEQLESAENEVLELVNSTHFDGDHAAQMKRARQALQTMRDTELPLMEKP
jgi:hypothetical protein